MALLTSLARLIAAEAGHAVPTKSVRHVHLSARPLVLVAVQLAGEACAPLAAMVGDDRGSPRLLTVHEPRNRTARFEWAAGLADVVLGYIDGYAAAVPDLDPGDGPGGGPGGGAAGGAGGRRPEPAPDAPQLLVPNPQTVAFLRLLGRSTRFRRTAGEYAVPPAVPRLGRWLTYYTERTEVTPSALLLPLATVLADHWATGQSATEDASLPALLGWIDPPAGQTGFQAARLAEDPVRCPPAGPATDPAFDNEVLAPAIDAYRMAVAAGDGAARARAGTALDRALAGQLAPAWELTWRGVDLLRALPEAPHVAARWLRDRGSFAAQVDWIRHGGAPQARRDSAVAAARRLARLEREQQQLAVERAYDDPLVMAGYRLTGEAFAGAVTWADPARQDTSGRRATLRPHLVVETSDEVVIEPGAVLHSPARPSQTAKVTDVVPAETGGLTVVTMELKGGMGRSLTPPPGTVPEVGEEVTYTTLSEEFQPSPRFPDREETPWTHGGPPPEYLPTDEDAAEEWS